MIPFGQNSKENNLILKDAAYLWLLVIGEEMDADKNHRCREYFVDINSLYPDSIFDT